MSKDFRLPSLAQHFDPPDGYVGHFGWMAGFSADAAFMNDAAERFTSHTKAQRASLGRITLALFLDPHNPPLSLTAVPGVAHLPFADLKSKPCRLIHAKVAVLGFRCMGAEQQGKWCVRLLVSTGNWTRQTVEESLDLAWAVDVCSDSLAQADDTTKAACADIKAANELMRWLRCGNGAFFDVRLLQSKLAQHEQKEVDGWIAECVKQAANGPSRFFDNRQESLLAQLPTQVKNTDLFQNNGNNYLALGSGFYDGGENANAVPTVPQSIIGTLKKAHFLTQNPKLDLFVNPQACQSVAASVDAMTQVGITVRPAKTPSALFGESSARALHAKFLFSANLRNNSYRCNSAWIYLGSGNLTNPGFAQKMSPNGGNLEAGVVFGVDGLLWQCGKGVEPAQVVTNLLPIQWDNSYESGEGLQAGAAWEPEPPSHFAPPVAWLVWHEGEASCELRLPDGASDVPPFVIVDAAGGEIQRNDKAYPWIGSQPQQVRCRWQDGNESREGIIPVMDAFGRIAAVKLPPIESMEEAWLQLADFPNPPAVDEPDDIDGSADEGGHANPSAIANDSPAANYPVRQMMELVENIAATQTGILKHDWHLWCRRLEQTLTLAKGSKAVEYFAKILQLNPLSPLRHTSFRPDYAEDGASDKGKQYEEALGRVEASWGVNGLAGLGDSNG